ncbi:hypothetical protein FMO003_25190 [Moritella sp. F3]|nr:hypothetical protein FMO001_18460 [Moritella sp. F1]GIC82238.1 hypothetical protein FMO003_25190 [Moritella sp. F3]
MLFLFSINLSGKLFYLHWIRGDFEYQKRIGLIFLTEPKTIESIKKDVAKTKSEPPLSIMTFIAIGEELGAELEIAFPEYKDANPKYAFNFN